MLLRNKSPLTRLCICTQRLAKMHLFLSVLENYERKQITQQICTRSRITVVQSALVWSVTHTAGRKEHANHLNIVWRPCPIWGKKAAAEWFQEDDLVPFEALAGLKLLTSRETSCVLAVTCRTQHAKKLSDKLQGRMGLKKA